MYEDLKEVKLPFNLEEVEDCCIECVRKQLKKYEKHVNKSGKPSKGKFLVPCKGIKKDVLGPDKRKVLTDEQIEHLESINDPVKFAAKYIKMPNGKSWIARDHQALILRCTSKKKVLRLGRRCLTGDSKVLMADGKWKSIQDIQVGDFVASRVKCAQLKRKKVISFFKNGIQDIFKIKLSNGMEVKCTSNHPLLTLETLQTGKGTRKVWKSLDSGLKKGQKVIVSKGFDKWGDIHNLELSRLLGYMITDGYFGKKGQTPKFTNNNYKMIEEVQCIVQSLFNYNCSIRQKGNGHDIHITDGNKGTGNKFVEIIKDLKLFEIKAKRKFIPDIVFDFDKESQMNFLNRMYSGDGGISLYKKRGKIKSEIFLVSTSNILLNQVKLILRKIGVETYISIDKNKDSQNPCYSLRISRADSIEKFFENIGFIFGKEEVSSKALLIAQTQQRRFKSGHKYFRSETIKSIEYVGKEETYDIEVKDTHNFIVDGIVNKNSGKTDLIVTEILFNAFTEDNLKLFVAGPQKTHTEEIFNRIRERVLASPLLRESITKDISAPYYRIILRNKTEIRGFAAGTKGKEGTVMRGQDANKIYLDEMDFIDQHALQGAIFPIRHTSADVSMLASSTPSGFKTPYYYMCEDDPTYKEFHYNYKILDWWEEIEADRSNYTEEEWTHEHLAEWGEADSGVYKPSYIDRALHDYKYSELTYNPIWKYTLGVDWNEKHGTEFTVLGYDPIRRLYQIVETDLIESSTFTQLKGIEKVIELNKKWKPIAVYVDSGNGSTNYEVLMKTAKENSTPYGDLQTAKLLEILKKYDSGSSITTKDNVTNKEVKKPAKPFMVNSSVRLFEQNKIWISSYDNVLEKQLRNYIIERKTPSGVSVYGLAEPKVLDHRLDSFNLASVAFHLEFNELYQMDYSSIIGSAINPRTVLTTDTGEKKIAQRPVSRDLNTSDAIGRILHSSTAGRIDFMRSLSSNRPGWATDQEEIEEARYQQRKYNRQFQMNRNRPSRTNF